MPVEMAIWRMAESGPVQISSSPLNFEQRLEDMLANDATMTGTDLLVLGRQVQTTYGGYVDILALDAEARVHVLELKRDRTPRDVVAQTLDYGSWAQGLSIDDLEQIYRDHNGSAYELDTSFAERFDAPLPDVVNADQQFTIVASELDATSDRIVEFLAEGYGVPINALFFRHFEDEGREYLARTWLLDPASADGAATRPSRSKVRPWNTRDFYVVLGRVEQGGHRWNLANTYGFLSAGGGSWYWKPLKNLSPGNRVFAYVGGAGYVGVGRVTGEMLAAREAKVEIEGHLQPLLERPDLDPTFLERASSDDLEVTEMVVPVDWLAARDLDGAFWEKGLFASQVTVCKLRDERTIETVEEAFGLSDPES